MNPETERQQLLFVRTEGTGLASRIVAWTLHDGNDVDADAGDLRHERGVDVLADGWRLIQCAAVEHEIDTTTPVTSAPAREWVFERIVRRHDVRRR